MQRRAIAREEIDRRQQEKLRRNDEELEEEKRQRREELDKVRASEQKRWDAESIRLRHEDVRAKAGFLKTKAEPVLHYRPWELRPEEEEVVKRQKENVEDVIHKELAESASEETQATGMDREMHSPVAKVDGDTLKTVNNGMKSEAGRDATEEATANGVTEPNGIKSEPSGYDTKFECQPDGEPEEDIVQDQGLNTEAVPPGKETHDMRQSDKEKEVPQQLHDNDHHHEELVKGHGQEDDVIY